MIRNREKMTLKACATPGTLIIHTRFPNDMKFKLTRKIVVVILATIALVGSGAYAGYFHDRSVKGADLTPQIFQLQNKLNDRDAQTSSLNAQISTLNSQLSALQQTNGNLHDQISQLQTSMNDLQTQLNNLQTPSMDGTFTFAGGSCFFGCSATVRDAWVNYGTLNARNVVVLTLTWSSAGAFVQTNTIHIGVVPGRSIGLQPDTNYNSASHADHLDWSFTFGQ